MFPQSCQPPQRSTEPLQSIIICEMKGDVSVGDSYTLSIGEQSSNYDTIVPTSAIREDSNGKFILIIDQRVHRLETATMRDAWMWMLSHQTIQNQQ